MLSAFAIVTSFEQYIAGGSRAEGVCIIYIWTVEGHLVTRLDGPNLGLLSLARHPVRPFLAAALTNGKVKVVVVEGIKGCVCLPSCAAVVFVPWGILTREVCVMVSVPDRFVTVRTMSHSFSCLCKHSRRGVVPLRPCLCSNNAAK